MYTNKNTVYADPYKLLQHKETSAISFQAEGVAEDFNEIDASLEDLVITMGMAMWGNHRCVQSVKKNPNYATLKSQLIKRRYSNDDQIAIILNKDESEEDALAYERMQGWRSWAADVAKRIVSAQT